MRAFLDDLRHAVRALARRPAYLLTTAGTLALVLGANAATLAVVNATLLRPLPFVAGERVMHLYLLPPGVTDPALRNPVQQMEFVRLRERTTTLRRLEGFLPTERVLAGPDGPVAVPGARVTPGLLAMLGVRTVAGRTFTAEEEQPGHDVALVSYDYWRGALGGASVIGTPLVIDGVPHTIVGVTAPGFPPPFIDAQLITPLVASAEPQPASPLRSVVTLGELADGVTPAQAAAEVTTLATQIAREFPAVRNGWSGGAQPVREWQFGASRAPALVLFGATALVLLIAAANLSNLTAAQATGRASELALRMALGASRRDLVRLQVAELTVVALAGVIPGLLMARVAVPALLALDPAAARALGVVTVDVRVQGLTLLLALATAAGAAVLPALQAAGRDTAATLADSTVRLSGSRRGGRVRRALVALQVALCLALLMTSAVVLDGLRHASAVAPGYDSRRVLTAQLRLPPTPYDTTERRAAVVDRLLPQLRALPGVESAATTTNDFVPGNSYTTLSHVDGRPTPDGQPRSSQFRRVSPGYFRTMRIRELRGRTFTEQDGPGTPLVAVVSRQFAEQFFPGEDAVGRALRRPQAASPPITIVGVVEDVRDVSLTRPPEPTLYLPWAQNNANAMPVTLVLRTVGAPEATAAAVRATVLAIDPAMPLRRVQSLDAFLADSVAPERFRTTVLAVIAGLGLVLAALGIYGVVHRAVVERSHEFAIRMALGANASRVITGVVRMSLADVTAGALAGGFAGAWITALLARVLDSVGPTRLAGVSAALGLLAAVAVAATLVPALRVVRVQPGDVLKAR